MRDNALRPLRLSAMALALAAGLPSLAQAQITTYGIIDVTVRHASNAGTGGSGMSSVGDGAYTGSRLGFRGTEDLGGGMKAFFNLEMGIDPSTGTLQQSTSTPNYGQTAATTGRAFGRASLVGLSAPVLGSVSLGRQYTLAHDLSGRFQPQANPNQDSLSVFSGHHVSRQDNMVKYNNQFGPVGMALSYTAGEGNGKAWGAAATYTAGPVDAVVYTQRMDSFNGAETRTITGLGGAWAAMPGLKLFAGGMQRDHEVSKQKNKVWTLGANYNLTDLLILTASYTEDRQTGLNAGTRTLAWVGLDYVLSKRTDVYVEVDQNRVTGSFPLPGFMGQRGSATGTSVGVRHRF